jgi:hypothetical protein
MKKSRPRKASNTPADTHATYVRVLVFSVSVTAMAVSLGLMDE